MQIKKSKLVLYKLMKLEYYKKVNPSNIEHISRYSLWKIFKNESKDNKHIYLRNIISEWLDNYEGTDEVLFKKIKRLINKTKIKLNDIENDSLFILEERAFSEIRKIKAIDVNNKLFKGEAIGAKYTNASLFKINKKPVKLFEGTLLISNKRIIFEDYNNFRFSSIKFYSNSQEGFEFITKDENKYLIRIHDQKTLNNIFNSIIKRKVKNVIKKY